MSPSPFTVTDDTVTLPPDPSTDPITATQQVFDAMRQYWNAGAPADYDTIGQISSVLAQALA